MNAKFLIYGFNISVEIPRKWWAFNKEFSYTRPYIRVLGTYEYKSLYCKKIIQKWISRICSRD